MLEDRTLPASWSSYAQNPQHTAVSPVASQPLQAILWQTPVDLDPQYNGNDLYIHYGSPLVTAGNTVIVPVKTGATGGFEVEGINGGSGALKWTQTTDYILPSHDWVPSYSPTLGPGGQLYFAGAGGTIYVINNPDATGASTNSQIAFYGLSNYTADPTAYNNNVFINTPITADSSGNLYFGFVVTGSTPLGLTSGIARIAANGTGIWMAASSAANDSGITEVVYNSAPALSNDGKTLYVAVSNGNGSDFGTGYLLALNSTNLQNVARVRLLDPKSGQPAYLPDDGSASVTVGPDGDVYFGVLEDPFPSNNDRGWLLHFSGDLSQTKTPGAFGWDDTASVVPASMVPSYKGTSAYLLMTKYNNYAGIGSGNGLNRIAILDPNATETDPITGATVMQEVLTILGPTPDPEYDSWYPGAVHEWCINTAAVDPFTDSILVNSEDGKLYRWDLTTNTFTQVVTLTPGIGEAYTPTVIGVDGTVYAINNATLFAVGQAHLQITAPASATAGTPFSITVTVENNAGNVIAGYTGTVHFTRSDTATGSAVPADYTFTAGDQGVHTFTGGVTLVTAGSQTITATDTGTSGITGSATVAVSAAAANSFRVAPSTLTPIVQTPFSVTVTALDPFNNTATSYRGFVILISTDASASFLGSHVFAAGDAGVFTFSGPNVVQRTLGAQTLTATDGTLSNPAAITVVGSGLYVTAFTPTPTGFTAAFSEPFVNNSTNPIHIYDAAAAGYGPPDVTLVGQTTGTTQHGSLIIDPMNSSFTFIKTGDGAAGLLAPDTYTVTFISGTTGFQDAGGSPLNGDGLHPGNFTTTFTVAASTAVVVSVSDFARGPDSTDMINVPNNSTNGIPITLSNGSGVTDATLVLQYNANLLTITGGTVNSALSGATFTVTPSGSGTTALATIVFHSSTALAAGAVQFGGLTATVPANALYKSAELLHFSSLLLNGGAIAATNDDGVHVVTFFGDTTGDGTYTSADSVLISQVVVGADSGFAAYPTIDPVVIGNLSGSGRLRANDATLLNFYLTGTTETQVPPYPGPPSNNPADPDPLPSLATNLQGSPDGTASVLANNAGPRTASSSALISVISPPTNDAASGLGPVPASGLQEVPPSAVSDASSAVRGAAPAVIPQDVADWTLSRSESWADCWGEAMGDDAAAALVAVLDDPLVWMFQDPAAG